jgi:hypothetical protein
VKLHRVLPLALIVLAIIGLRWLLAPDPILSAPLERLIDYGLQRTSAAGWPVRLVRAEGSRAVLAATGRRLQAREGSQVTYLLVSEDDVALIPSEPFRELLLPARVDSLYRWAEVPLTFRRPDAAVQALAFAFASVLARAGKIPRDPPLPPLVPVGPTLAMEGAGESVDWGLPLALFIPLALGFARRRLQA